MFGSTMKLIGGELARFGVQSSFVPQTDAAAWQAAVRPETRLLFAETPTNPLTDLCDIRRSRALRMTRVCCWRWITALRRPHCSVHKPGG